MYDVTYHGLHCWSKSLFEKLGWMVLAHSHGHNDETNCYIKNIKNLEKAIKEKIEMIECEDKRNDLMILQRNVKLLLEHSEKDFCKKKKIKK